MEAGLLYVIAVWLLLFTTSNVYNSQRLIKSGDYNGRVAGLNNSRLIWGKFISTLSDHRILVHTPAGEYLMLDAEKSFPIDIF